MPDGQRAPLHIVMFGDQHVESSGGAQVSMRLQREFLERAGHTVTVVVPRMWGRRFDDAAYVETPSIPIQPDREYSFTWPGRRTDAFIDRELARRPRADIVHVQGDFWGAFLGHRYARRHNIPVVHTMHNRVDVGIRAVTPLAPIVLRALNLWASRALPKTAGSPRGSDGWAYLSRLASGAAAVTAPSGHFAHRLQAHGVFPRVDVVWNGMADDLLDEVRGDGAAHDGTRPRLVWVGRMSPEKRLLPFVKAIAVSGIDADVEIIGGGGQLRAAKRLVATMAPRASVTFAGRMPYAQTLAHLARADALVQTSIGFETQGMTPFEAVALGTPAIISDPDIGAELRSGFWQVGDDSIAALAETLRDAVADIADGTAVTANPAIAEEFRQSSRTRAMLDVYERVARS